MAKKKKILILRFSSIGDIVLCSPIVRCAKLQLDAEIHFATKQKYHLLLSENPHIDQIWTFEKDITSLVTALRKEAFDLVIDLHKNLRSKRLIASLGVKSISFDKVNLQKWIRVHLGINYLPDKHLIDRYFEAVAKLNISDDGQGMDFFYKVNETNVLKNLNLQDQKYSVLVLGATYYTKRIPEVLIDEVLNTFVNEQFVLIGGPDVVELASNISAKHNHVINGTGILTLQESAFVMDKSQLVVSGDTGMMHIAAALKKPIVSIWGGTHHDLGMYPYYGSANKDQNIAVVNENISCSPCSKIGKHECPKGHFKCMLEIDPNRLTAAIKRQIKA